MTEKTKFREGERVIVLRDSSEGLDGAYQPGEETEITEVVAGAGLIYYKTPRGLVYGADDLKKVEEEVAVYKRGTIGSIMNNLKGYKNVGVIGAFEDEATPERPTVGFEKEVKKIAEEVYDRKEKEKQDKFMDQIKNAPLQIFESKKESSFDELLDRCDLLLRRLERIESKFNHTIKE